MTESTLQTRGGAAICRAWIMGCRLMLEARGVTGVLENWMSKWRGF
jgi:hypothetical protein